MTIQELEQQTLNNSLRGMRKLLDKQKGKGELKEDISTSMSVDMDFGSFGY